MDVILDFHGDFRQIVARILIENGVKIDPNEPYNDAIYRFFANRRRRLAVQKYEVRESRELYCPEAVAAGYAELKHELEQGINVNARLSRQLSKATFEDRLLNDWGVTHFHLGLRETDDTVQGTDIVLFALVRDSVVYGIGFFPHGSWAKLEILQILQHNWPETMEHARVNGVTGFDDFTDEDREKLRKAGATIMTTVNGIVYAPVGGGYTTARTSMNAHWEADRAIFAVKHYEEHVRTNIVAIVEDIEAQGLRIGFASTFRFGFADDGRAIAIESKTGAYAILGDFPA